MCIRTNNYEEVKNTCLGDTDTETAETGQEQDHTATCHHGKDQDGSTAEAPAGNYTDHTHPRQPLNQKTKPPY